MENIENLVTEEVTENVESTTEETPKTYTEAEFNAKLDEVLGKKIARKEAKIRKEYERKYGNLEEVLRAGTGKESVEDMTDTFKAFYEQKGIKIPQKPTYSARELDILARAEAEEIISSGYDEVVEEVERLAEIGAANMSAKERAMFKVLAEHRQNAERGRELSKIGVTEDVYNGAEFREFAGKFNPNTPISDIYDIYRKTTKPQKEIRTMGSMKQIPAEEVKDYYSPEEIDRLSMKDLDNPRVWEAVRRSMTGG